MNAARRLNGRICLGMRASGSPSFGAAMDPAVTCTYREVRLSALTTTSRPVTKGAPSGWTPHPWMPGPESSAPGAFVLANPEGSAHGRPAYWLRLPGARAASRHLATPGGEFRIFPLFTDLSSIFFVRAYIPHAGMNPANVSANTEATIFPMVTPSSSVIDQTDPMPRNVHASAA